MSKVLILVASVGKNVELAATLEQEVKAQGGECEVVNVVDLNLPLYSTRAEEHGIPSAAAEMANKMCGSRGLIWVAPEYNGSMPPVLNNLIAWVSRSGNNDWRGAFNGKIGAIATFSGGGGASVLGAMRSQLAYLGVNVLGRQIQTNSQKALNPDSAKAVIKQLLDLTA